MNCHENKENPNKKQQKVCHNNDAMHHILMMAVCCGLPVILLLIVPFLGIFGTNYKHTIASIIPFLCPVMMLFMIPMMLKPSKHGKSCCSENKEESTLPEKKLK